MDSSGNKAIALCDPYVWEDPRYMFRSFWPGRQHDRSRGVCASELVNHVIVLYLVAIVLGLVVGAIAKVGNLPLMFGLLATVYLIPTFMKLQKVEHFRMQFVGSQYVHTDSEDTDLLLAQVRGGRASAPTDSLRDQRVKKGGETSIEGFTSGNGPRFSPNDGSARHEGFTAGNSQGRGTSVREGFTEPQPIPDFNQTGTVGNPTNPFNNVLVSDIVYAPTRTEAPDITTTDAKVALDDFFRVQWYSDPTDVFGKSQSQREFVTAPVTTIPNDQGSYQKWLYGIPGKTCKEGNPKACWGGTDGGAMPWLNL